MPTHDPNLLAPSLTGTGATPALYSAGTGYLSAFFGGPLAGAVIALLNARRLGRLTRDGWLAGLALAVTVAFVWWLERAGGEALLVRALGSNGPRLGLRIAGLAFFGLAYLTHRRYYRSAQILGMPAPAGWIPGILAVVAGVATQAGLVLALAP